MKTNYFFVFVIMGIFLIAIGIFVLPKFSSGQNKQGLCPLDVKVCPDGSFIGRTAPQCQFAPCPQWPVFGSEVNFTVAKQVTFGDGLSVTLAKITDSRCKAGVVCFWAGELAPLFKVTGGNFGNVQDSIQFGTVKRKVITKSGYMFELKRATVTAATIIVTKESKK